MTRSWDSFADFCEQLQSHSVKGRATLRRKWPNLRALAARVVPQVAEGELLRLLGKHADELDPEENDLKALASYGAGKGLIGAEELKDALAADARAAPLHFLAELSGKAFGESVAPLICEYWLCDSGDGWTKVPAAGYYDIRWAPADLAKQFRIEIKASSEYPEFRFQQIRHPRMSGSLPLDYDALLCLGVTASSLEFWFVPSPAVVRFIESGLIVNQHGGQKHQSDTYGLTMTQAARLQMAKYAAEPETLRSLAISIAGNS